MTSGRRSVVSEGCWLLGMNGVGLGSVGGHHKWPGVRLVRETTRCVVLGFDLGLV